jgi:hypothetical protein
MRMADRNYYVRPHNVLSAVSGLSSPGHMTYGPYANVPAGSYQVDFFLRSPQPVGKMATLDVYDSNAGVVLASRDVQAADMVQGNDWTRITLNVPVTNARNSLEFRTWWWGTSNLDVAAIRVRR